MLPSAHTSALEPLDVYVGWTHETMPSWAFENQPNSSYIAIQRWPNTIKLMEKWIQVDAMIRFLEVQLQPAHRVSLNSVDIELHRVSPQFHGPSASCNPL